VAQIDTKRVLWENLEALMNHHFEKPNLSELHRRSKIGLASLDRIKKQETSVGIDTLEKLADVFGLQAWHLLTPQLNPSNPPVIWLTQTEQELYERLRNAAQQFAQSSH
jgi:transcriptional regulator with XRE-family HTH domain